MTAKPDKRNLDLKESFMRLLQNSFVFKLATIVQHIRATGGIRGWSKSVLRLLEGKLVQQGRSAISSRIAHACPEFVEWAIRQHDNRLTYLHEAVAPLRRRQETLLACPEHSRRAAFLTMLRTGFFNSPFMASGVLSLVLHIAVIGFLSLFTYWKVAEPTVPLVTITLVEAQTTAPQKITSGQAPSMRTIRRPSKISVPMANPSQLSSLLPQPASMVTSVPRFLPDPPFKTPQRRALQDQQATNALMMRNLFKTARSLTTFTSGPQDTGLNMAAITTRDAPLTSLATSGIRAAVSQQPHSNGKGDRRILMTHTSRSAEVSQSGVGLSQSIPPVYPRVAREEGWEGTVIIQVEVQPDGRPAKIRLHTSSGHAILDQAALKAVKQWHFIPARDGNIPVRKLAKIPIRFELQKQG